VLSACNPLYSAAQRIIVFARLQGMQPTKALLSASTSPRAASTAAARRATA
jgi:hypothetical protein